MTAMIASALMSLLLSAGLSEPNDRIRILDPEPVVASVNTAVHYGQA